MSETLRIYGLQILIGLIALLGILKDWSENKKRTKKHGKLIYLGLFVLTVVLLILSVIDTHSNRVSVFLDKQRAKAAKQVDDARIVSLTDQVSQLRADSKANNDGFRESFGGLYKRFADLQAKVTNAELIKEIDDTKKELRATQEKLNTPKSTLTASFYRPDFTITPPMPPLLELTLPRPLDGKVSVGISIINASNVAALRGEIVLRICNVCQYAKEPDGFAKRNGAPDADRGKVFDHLFANTILEKIDVNLIVPPYVSRLEIGVNVVCENCERMTQSLFVVLQ